MPRSHAHQVFWSAAVFHRATACTLHIGFWATDRGRAHHRLLETFGDVQVLELRAARPSATSRFAVAPPVRPSVRH